MGTARGEPCAGAGGLPWGQPRAGAHHHGRRSRFSAPRPALRWEHFRMMRGVIRFFRANPQALLLLVICLVLGLGTFLAVIISLVQNSHGTLSGDPSGVIGLAGVWLAR